MLHVNPNDWKAEGAERCLTCGGNRNSGSRSGEWSGPCTCPGARWVDGPWPGPIGGIARTVFNALPLPAERCGTCRHWRTDHGDQRAPSAGACMAIDQEQVPAKAKRHMTPPVTLFTGQDQPCVEQWGAKWEGK